MCTAWSGIPLGLRLAVGDKPLCVWYSESTLQICTTEAILRIIVACPQIVVAYVGHDKSLNRRVYNIITIIVDVDITFVFEFGQKHSQYEDVSFRLGNCPICVHKKELSLIVHVTVNEYVY